MPTPARTPDGRLLDVPEDASREEIEASIARRDEEDRRNREALALLGSTSRGNYWH